MGADMLGTPLGRTRIERDVAEQLPNETENRGRNRHLARRLHVKRPRLIGRSVIRSIRIGDGVAVVTLADGANGGDGDPVDDVFDCLAAHILRLELNVLSIANRENVGLHRLVEIGRVLENPRGHVDAGDTHLVTGSDLAGGQERGVVLGEIAMAGSSAGSAVGSPAIEGSPWSVLSPLEAAGVAPGRAERAAVLASFASAP